MKLTQAKVKAAKPHPKQDGHRRHAKYGDGRGLWLMVDPNGNKSWAFLYTINKRSRHMGLGSLLDLDLDAARDKALELRRLVKRGIDPLAQLQAERASNQGRLPASEHPVPTFDAVAEKVIEARAKRWRNDKSEAQWKATLETYAYPVLKGVPVNQITTADVRKVLEPIWDEKPDTAKKLRQRIMVVLEDAVADDLMQPEQIVKITAGLKKALQPHGKRKKNGHAALPHEELPGFMTKLRTRPGFAARALEFTILTAARSGETRGAVWSEIDLDNGVWTVPADRMKAAEEHKVPLSAPALALLRGLHKEEDSELVFPSPTKAGEAMSDMTLLQVLRRMDVEATVHGFRATFRSWVAERTNFPGEVAEAALAHQIPNEVERAYKRTTFFEKRRELMKAWASYCDGPATGDKVVPIKAAQ